MTNIELTRKILNERHVNFTHFYSENLYIREYTSGNLRKIWSQGYCVQTALNTSFALLLLLENRRQVCVFFISFLLQSQLNLAGEPDVF